MDITINRDKLLAGIDQVSVAIDKRSSQPAFTVMRVEAREKKLLRLVAAGEKCSVDTVVESDAKTLGHFHVSPGSFQAVIDRMPIGPVKISMNKEGRVTVTSGKRKVTFADRLIDTQPVEDPGEKAAWVEMDGRALLADCAHALAAGEWVNGSLDRQDGVWLVRKGGKLEVFAGNGYLLALVTTDTKIDAGDPIFVPALALKALSQMTKPGKEIKVFEDDRRLYLETAETLASFALGVNSVINGYDQMTGLLKPARSRRGPSFKIERLREALRSVMVSSNFASEGERAGDRGERLLLTLGERIKLELSKSASDAIDEFEPTKLSDVADLKYKLSSRFLESLLSSLAGLDEADSYCPDDQPDIFVLSSQGVTIGCMQENPNT